jgi:S1-C subfamily serine protease
MQISSAVTAAYAILAIGALTASAQRPPDIEQTVVDAIARAEPSIVAITRKPAGEPGAGEKRGADAFGELRQSTSTNDEFKPVACGVMIDAAGLVLTEYLAVREDDDHAVTTIEGTVHAAKIRAADPRSSLALLEIPAPASSLQTSTRSVESRTGDTADNALIRFPAIAIADASTVRKGQFVIVIGNPFAIVSDGQASASLGIITNVAQKAPPGTNLNDAPGPAKDFRTTIHHLGTLLQTDARLGWSTGGGALINLRGELVGLTTTASVIAGHEQPAGYAIPMNATIRRVIDQLKQGREVEYGMLGIGFGADSYAANDAGRQQLSVSVVYPTGPAARAGLKPGDVITRVNDRPVAEVDAVQLGVSALPPGATVDIAYERGGRREAAQVTLAKLAVAGNIIATVRPEAWRGMRVDYATTLDVLALKQAIDSGALDREGCVLVAEVEQGSIAWRAGARAGMFVSHVASTRVTTPEEFRDAVEKLGADFDLKFTTPLSPEAKPDETSD